MTQLGNSSSQYRPPPGALPRIGITMATGRDRSGSRSQSSIRRRGAEPVCPGDHRDAQLLATPRARLICSRAMTSVRYGESLRQTCWSIIFHLDNVGGFVEPGGRVRCFAGKAAARYIEVAVELCAAGSIDACHGPINKRAPVSRGL